MRHILPLCFFFFIANLLYAQPCKDCSQIDPDAICSAVFDPVCGCDGVTYANSCEAVSYYGIIQWTEGECPNNNVSICSDLSGVNFGLCQAVLGWGIINGEPTLISGCSTVVDGVDYGSAFYADSTSIGINCLCSMTSSISEFYRIDAEIFPNPSSDHLFIRYDDPQGLTVALMDISGRTITSSYIFSGDRLDVSELPEGLYLLTLSNEGERVYSRSVSIKR